MKKLVLLIFVGILPLVIFGQTDLVRWNGANLQPNAFLIVNNGTISANAVSGNFVTDNYTDPFPGFRGSNYNTSQTTPDYNNFMEFAIKANAGNTIALKTFKFTYARGDGGPQKFEVRYSTDSSIGTAVGGITQITSTMEPELITVDLTGVTVQSGQTLYIRVYPFDRQNIYWNGGTFHIKHGTAASGQVDNGTGPTIRGTVSTAAAPCTAATAPLQINGNSTICGGDNVNLQATGGTEGTNATYQWGTGSQIGSNVIVSQTTATLSHVPSATTTYWVRRVSCNNTYTSGITKTVTVAFGDQATYGNDKWIGYVYTWTGTPASTNYKGYVTENEIFDRSVGYNTIEGVETNLCAAPAEKFLVRYKKKINFAEGNYNITVGGDDGYRISFDGGSTWEIADWTAHSYSTTSKLIALSGTKDVVLEYYEDGGEARVSFSYGIIQGNPAQYGNNVWNVYAFNYYDNNDNQILVPSSSYSGFYTQNTLGVDTRDIANNGWNDQTSPSSSATWTGAPVPNDNFTISHKRQGFPCGRYQIVMSNWDDKAILYINDVQQWVVNGYSGGSFTLPGTFNLNKNSKVELRLKEGGGAAGIKMEFINMPLIHNGTNWVDGVPNNETGIRIDNNYTISDDMEVCSCTVSAGKTLTIQDGKTLIILENIVVEAGAKIVLENNGSLVQIDDNATYTGALNSFEMKRNSQPVFRLDYTYWSSPVKENSGFTLSNLSPQTMFNKFLKWNHAGTPQAWQVVSNGAEAMVPGRGYLVRAPQNYNIEGAGAPQEFVGSFIGTPNNGVITHAVSGSTTANRWNLIGNPYPSAIDAETFLNENSEVLGGTLYFWTHNSAFSDASGYAYSASDYATWNLSGGTGTTGQGANQNSNLSVPTGKIAAGQSFFVQGVSEGNGNVVFNNSMRVTQPNVNNQFFKPAPSEPVENWATTGKHRVWLNLTSTQNHFNQILVGYIENATNGLDNSYDGGVFSGGAVSLYSILDSKNLTIQGRALPFSNQDEVPLGYKTTLTGTLKISIDHVDGLFEGQNVYLKDNLLNVVHNLKDSDYEFETVPGTFNDRFVLQYLPQETLGTDVPTIDSNSMVVFNNNNQINIKSSEQVISKVEIYDLQGRVIFTKNNIDGQSFATQSLSAKNQLVIVKVTTDNNSEFVKKVMLK